MGSAKGNQVKAIAGKLTDAETMIVFKVRSCIFSGSVSAFFSVSAGLVVCTSWVSEVALRLAALAKP